VDGNFLGRKRSRRGKITGREKGEWWLRRGEEKLRGGGGVGSKKREWLGKKKKARDPIESKGLWQNGMGGPRREDPKRGSGPSKKNGHPLESGKRN